MRHLQLTASLVLLALACGKPAPSGAVPDRRPIERLSRCAVRVLPSSPEHEEALRAELARRLAGGRLVHAELSPSGDGVRFAMVEGLPAPSGFGATAAAAAARARALYETIDDLFAVDAGTLRFSAVRERPDSPVPWTVTGVAEERETEVLITMDEAGRVVAIGARRPEPAPPSPCDAPSIALDDPRIVKAVVGRTVESWSWGGSQRTDFVIEARDVGRIDQAVVPLPERRFGPDAYARVIRVAIRDGMWTALLDPDTAAVIDIDRSFVN